jgi:hypothetical protein
MKLSLIILFGLIIIGVALAHSSDERQDDIEHNREHGRRKFSRRRCRPANDVDNRIESEENADIDPLPADGNDEEKLRENLRCQKRRRYGSRRWNHNRRNQTDVDDEENTEIDSFTHRDDGNDKNNNKSTSDENVKSETRRRHRPHHHNRHHHHHHHHRNRTTTTSTTSTTTTTDSPQNIDTWSNMD